MGIGITASRLVQQSIPDQWNDEILVPFSLESRLFRRQRLLNPDETLWYHTEFNIDPKLQSLTLLHFEAVDYRCDVYVWSENRQPSRRQYALEFDIAKAAKPEERVSGPRR